MTEAPPPCEACRLYDGSNSRYFLDAEMREALFASHHDQQDTLLAAKDAEIAELRAENVGMRGLLGDGCWHIVGCNCRAALAPKEKA